MEKSIQEIAVIQTDFPEKFGLPRQSGLVEELEGRVVLHPQFAREEALRGLEDFSHIWLIWGFSEAKHWSLTVRPPRLGGNRRMGVFATRSPFRPNGLGLSAVRLLRVDAKAGILTVAGIDLMDGTPIYDIKPYLPYVDSYPDAVGGFGARVYENRLHVTMATQWRRLLSRQQCAALIRLLEQDPRPSYQDDPQRVYAFSFAGYTVRFRVAGSTLQVTELIPPADEPAGQCE